LLSKNINNVCAALLYVIPYNTVYTVWPYRNTVQLIKQANIAILSPIPINKILPVSSKNLGVFFDKKVKHSVFLSPKILLLSGKEKIGEFSGNWYSEII
jgi:hypothetical protein